MKIWWYVGFAVLLALLAGLVYLSLQTPQLEREWSPDQAVLATAEWNGDEVTIKNVRNFRYASTTEYVIGYYDTILNLADLERVDYIVEPFGSVGAAHTFVSFGFADGQQIAISVEIRKEVGETFSPLRGVLRQYELMYVIADERDVIDLRANHRGHDVYLYPTIATPAQGRELFRAMLLRANALAESPEFYNTVTSNCATNIVDHLNEIATTPIGWDYRLLLPAYSDALAYELGLIAPERTLAEARTHYQINNQAARYQGAEDFSARLREPVPGADVTTQAREELVQDERVLLSEPVVPDTLIEIEIARVVRVVDGDTIIIDRGQGDERLRYLGVDTPETVHPGEPTGCFGSEASAYNQSLVAGQSVRLERDVSDMDKYGRLLRYVYVGDQMVNLALVQGGYAQVVTYPPDVRHVDTFRTAESAAREAARGLWGSVCAGEYEPRLEVTTSSGQPPLDASCVVKGNISQTSGERIYHIPGCEYYEQTRINEVAGEQWFCSEAEAAAAGWRKALNCPL